MRNERNSLIRSLSSVLFCVAYSRLVRYPWAGVISISAGVFLQLFSTVKVLIKMDFDWHDGGGQWVCSTRACI